MKTIIAMVSLALLSGCSTTTSKSSKTTQIPLESILDELQYAVNTIANEASGGTLPKFKEAEVVVSTSFVKSTSGKFAIIVSGEKGKSITDSSTLTLTLKPGADNEKLTGLTIGKALAESVISAVEAIKEEDFLKLETLVIEAGLVIEGKRSIGGEGELAGITLTASKTKTSTGTHSIKLTFNND